MYIHNTQIRVRYGETDKMGYVYYGNYTEYYEVGRVEALRSVGLEYKSLEDKKGIMMPVIRLSVDYIRPAYYDDLLTIITKIVRLPDQEINFETEIFNEKNKLINKAKVDLCCVDMQTMKRVTTPPFIISVLKPYFG
ncbi:MAG TPA: thioesterase family protein [Saprospiraceae bacterium]|nr:thioesterase family protein [Saprospiraceae bacterium]